MYRILVQFFGVGMCVGAVGVGLDCPTDSASADVPVSLFTVLSQTLASFIYRISADSECSMLLHSVSGPNWKFDQVLETFSFF